LGESASRVQNDDGSHSGEGGSDLFVVELAFTDDSQRLAARPAHRQRLQTLHEAGVVRMAGPFADDAGALLIFDVPDPATLDRLLDEDPYFRTPGVTVVRKQQWSPLIVS
jgi:uncharacterized protein YciI